MRSVSRVKEGNYVTIQWFAVKNLNLKGNELIVYSIIYGFSQNNQEFNGSLQYLADWTNSTRQCIQGVIKSLLEKGLIVKSYTSTDKVSTNRYRAVDINELESKNDGCTKNLYRGVQESCTEGVQKIWHNNILLEDSNNIYIGDFASPDSVDGDFSETPPSSNDDNSTMYEDAPTAMPLPNEYTQPHAVGKCDLPKSGSSYVENFERLWKLYPKKEGKSSVSAKSKKALLSAGYDEIASCIDFYVRTKPDWQHLMNGSTFFNGRWKDYVTQNSDETSVTPQGGEDDGYDPFAQCD